MKRLLAAVLGLFLLNPFVAQAAQCRTSVSAKLHHAGTTNHIYAVSCLGSKDAIAVAYYAVEDNTSRKTGIALKAGEVAVCPFIGVYEGCYHFPSMEVALDWVRREVR